MAIHQDKIVLRSFMAVEVQLEATTNLPGRCLLHPPGAITHRQQGVVNLG